MASDNFELRAGITYATHDGVALAGDLYLPKGRGTVPGAGRGAWRRLAGGRAQRVPVLGKVSRRARLRAVLDQLPAGEEGQQDVPAGGTGRAGGGAVRARQCGRVQGRSRAHRAVRRVGRRSSGLAGGAQRRRLPGRLSAGQARGASAPRSRRWPASTASTTSRRCGTATACRARARTTSRIFSARRRWKIRGSISTPRRSTMRPSPTTRSASFSASAPRTISSTARTQTDAFLLALKQAGFFVRTCIVQGAPHYWLSDPIDEPGSYPGFVAPRLVRFLQERL